MAHNALFTAVRSRAEPRPLIGEEAAGDIREAVSASHDFTRLEVSLFFHPRECFREHLPRFLPASGAWLPRGVALNYHKSNPVIPPVFTPEHPVTLSLLWHVSSQLNFG